MGRVFHFYVAHFICIEFKCFKYLIYVGNSDFNYNKYYLRITLILNEFNYLKCEKVNKYEIGWLIGFY